MRVHVAGTPDAASDRAVAQWFERWLEREHPGTAWRVREPGEHGRGLEPPAGEIGGARPGRVDDDADGLAA